LRKLLRELGSAVSGLAPNARIAAANQRAELAQSRLRNAIDALPEGIVFLDSEGRYILWNRQYAEIYHKSADLFEPGIRLEDTLRVGIVRGDYPDAIGREEEWLKARMALLENPGTRHEQWISDGRCIMIEERRTPDGGTIGLRVDITEMKRREESFRLLFESNPVPLLVCDADANVVLAANEAAVAYYGYPPAEFTALPLERLFDAGEWHDARRAIGHAAIPQERIWAQARSDGARLESILFTREIIHDGRPASLVGIFDVTERRRAEARIAHMARHDDLTDLPNRAHFRDTLHQSLSDGQDVAVLMIDLDHFKAINDTLGHSVGDRLLAEAAARMRDTADDDAMVARIGGDEFAMLLPLHGDHDAAMRLAEQLVLLMAEPFFIEAHVLTIGATVGIAFAPANASEPEDIIKYADLALYAAKQDGRSGWRLFTTDLDEAAQQRRRLELDLRRAVHNGELVVHYQTLVDLRTGSVDGYEALLRWNHPDRGLVMPADFIPLAEEVGLIDLIGQQVLQTACRDAAAWPPETRVAVNISPTQFRDPRILHAVTQALASSGIEPCRLELEITEAVLIEKNPTILSTMQAIRDLGVGIAMDDFGTGYSSLSYLLSYPFSKIKIDRSFVDGLDRRPEAQAVVRAVIGLGESLGMMVTAEGIEQPEVVEYLRGEGCLQGQGYLFARAVPASELPRADEQQAAAA
jgi:diguanylate cyclase (GGDEF)-like protein/PAS domain S-box-containing protein